MREEIIYMTADRKITDKDKAEIISHRFFNADGRMVKEIFETVGKDYIESVKES